MILVCVEIRRLSFRAVGMLGSGIIKGMNILTNKKKRCIEFCLILMKMSRKNSIRL